MEYVDQLRSLARRLDQANRALMVWDQIEAQERLPAAVREPIEAPELSRRALKTQLILLMADMSRLEQEIFAAAVVGNN